MKRLIIVVLSGILTLTTVLAQERNEDYDIGLRYYKDSPAKSVPYLQRAADAGHSGAQVLLGLLYQTGKGVDKNYRIAMELFQKAEEANNPEAVEHIGILYEEGLGVEPNMPTAFGYYKRAADMGSAHAAFLAGQCYLEGSGTDKDITNALKYLEQSAMQKYGNELLGDLYYEGVEVPRNLEKALSWYRSGNAKSYDGKSRFQLAYLYYTFVKDYDKALDMLYQLHKEEYPDAFRVYQEVLSAKEEAKLPDTAPSFPGGENALHQFIRDNMKYPKKSASKGIQGEVVLSFTVMKDGRLANFRVECGINPELDKEAVRLLLVMPKWNPATRQGQSMAAEVMQTITFALD